MAYDHLSNDELIADAWAKANDLENLAQAVMRRLTEMKARGCHCDHDHEPAPAPVEPAPDEPTPAPIEPHPHEPAAPSGDVLASSVQPVPSTFDKAPWIGTGGEHTTGENAPDLGAFRLTGNVSHLNYDDAIVFPGQAGAAHLHMNWGNTRVDAHSTYETLRRNGNGTTEGGPLLRSSYWMPAPLIGDTVLIPEHITMYYKRAAQMGDPMPGGVERLAHIPRGLRMITRSGKFVLRKPGAAAIESKFRMNNAGTPMPDLLAQVAPGDTFQIVLMFPQAWDGQRVDSADHMSHMSQITERDPNTGGHIMPAAHPVLIASIEEILTFTVQDGEDWTKFELSSDRQMRAAPGSTLHGDYFEAQDDEIREEWHAHAIERRLNCNGGDMGSGRALRRPPSFQFHQQPNRVPLASVPVGGEYRLID